MKKYWKPTIIVLVLLLVTVLIVGLIHYFSVPRLSQTEKDKVEKAFYYQQMGFSRNEDLIWYDENGCVEEECVWRYIGTYGDCYAFLRIGDGMNATGEQQTLPDLLQGLSCDVYYPNHANVMLYHTKRTFTSKELFGNDENARYQLMYIDSIENLEEWITDEQLEQLTQDIEKIAAEHN